MDRERWKGIYGETPESFRAKVERAIDRAAESALARRRVNWLLAAAVIVALTTGAAVAAGMGIVELINERGGGLLPQAQELAETDVGAVENEYLTMRIEEALYDGQTVLVQMLITPKNPEKYVLYNVEYGEDRRGDFFIYETDGEKEM